jgi:predicted nucleic acid-binding protein
VVVVSNSSPLIALARIQRLDLVPGIFESVLILRLWLVKSRLRFPIFQSGREFRRQAEPTGLNVMGTLGALLTAKRTGLLKSIRPELDALLRTSFFLNPKLYDELLRARWRD